MHQNIVAVAYVGLSAWELVGLLGTLLFSGRWIVQAIASHRAGTSVVSSLFWYMSIFGNLLILIYFIFDLISCLLTMTGGLRLPHVQR